MKIIATALLLLACSCAFGSNQFDDGVYLRAAGAPAPEIICQDDQKVFLGARQALNILKIEFLPLNNANTLFQLTLTVPFDESIKGDSFILLVAGTAYRQHILGTGKEMLRLGFTISGGDEAKAISEFFKEPLPLRSHPGYNLLTTFTPTKPEFDLGEEVTAILRIRNVGTNTVAFMKGGRNRAPRDNQYVFSARYKEKQVEDIGTSAHFGGLASKRVIKPGDMFEDTISLSKWFAFDRPGWYEIHGSYYLDIKDPELSSWTSIWEDYATADFSVKIRTDIGLEQADPGYPPQGVGSPDP